jgi:hypothetical protein
MLKYRVVCKSKKPKKLKPLGGFLLLWGSSGSNRRTLNQQICNGNYHFGSIAPKLGTVLIELPKISFLRFNSKD